MNFKTSIIPIIYSILILAGLSFFTFFVLFFVTLFGQIHYISLIITIAILIYVLLLAKVFQFLNTKKRKKVFGGVAIATILLASIRPIYHTLDAKIPTVDAEVSVYEYMPNTNDSKLVTLDEKPTLQISGNLPKIDGATALYPLYSAIVQATYPEKLYEPYDSEIMVNTTPNAYDNLFNGTVDLIFVAGPSKSQINRAEQLGLELKLTPIGREAFVFFVHQKNSIDGLTMDQIKDIYSGKVRNWKEVGGANDSIRAFQRPEESGSQTALQLIMGDTPIMEAPIEDVASGMGGIINQVAEYKNYKNAIGYTFRFYSTEMVRNDQIKLLKINGVEPTKETIRNDEYPISSEFYIVTAGTKNPNVEKLTEWVLSQQGQQLVEKVGYVPVGEN
ncbi:PstS family phosphate ABC transporter substrate-binding protein [Ureibacillus sp. NPDC094379]